MNAWVLIIVLLTADGPRELRHEIHGDARPETICHMMRARVLREPGMFTGAVVIDARCVREYEA